MKICACTKNVHEMESDLNTSVDKSSLTPFTWGDDIIFRAFDATTRGRPSSCTLDHQIEKYVNTTGELVAWVRLPSVNASGAGSSLLIWRL
jgi:hypothetical protein